MASPVMAFTSTLQPFRGWDRIAEKLSFMLVFGDLVWIGMTQCRKRTVQKMWKSVIHGKSLQSLAGIVFQCRRLRMIEGSSKLQSPLSVLLSLDFLLYVYMLSQKISYNWCMYLCKLILTTSLEENDCEYNLKETNSMI
ncbi:uncharacterized protein LOC130742537 [Lotus japonicus]|uniref:uncharacterized protein LOC130716192 n=1 Tax=Lotus japonicus TaxID=34305 RepID=UPI00258274FD|nr:uncharacterized protein LOC130709916 isoform X1 [Lotus japonicus]XP_057422377.1 uncharacterized protein LOC130716192 [Lotus japonicus]XP_057442014.1 uncharacterized protein LOC130733774 [Lotus japonicus]XP_057450616.1 uncharacterized protein LOC130742537 [Lotus japonicus]